MPAAQRGFLHILLHLVQIVHIGRRTMVPFTARLEKALEGFGGCDFGDVLNMSREDFEIEGVG